MRKEAARMIRPALRPFLIGTVLALVLLGSTVRADATRPEQKMLAPAQHMLTARSEAVDAAEATLPTGFQESTVFEGLTFPTNFRFSPDGRVFVAEKSGIIKVFDSPADTTPTVFADLRTQVDDYWDRGLLGLALDPDFPASPYIYVLYTYDAGPGQVARIWKDVCPTPPGPTTDGCVVTGHLARLTASGDTMTGEEQVLITDWCQQFPSHSVGDLQFGPDGALYVSAGEGANF
jgi:glucose/arabinose dehydrogenase